LKKLKAASADDDEEKPAKKEPPKKPMTMQEDLMGTKRLFLKNKIFTHIRFCII
jgi:hypothetical protein